ncbi:hypothetical protein [Brevundimonas sp.]|uniref:hypothetical protein n=1 Tax=Brevundimonas sp. TaxID=1871086 RepID=UPI002BD66D41|nr:hypothetical protein [Brevundimonas sp.]HWQ85530.1 hypothetical protein [Brevundimonas sp.]
MTERRIISARTGGALFAAAGLLWFAAAWLGDEVAFYGVGVMFVLLGLATFARSRKGGG